MRIYSPAHTMKLPMKLPNGLGLMLSAAFLAGCAGPLDRTLEDRLREDLVGSNRAYLQAVAAGPVVELSRPPSDVETELSNERRTQLDRMSGPAAYQKDELRLGADLLGKANTDLVVMNLREVIRRAVRSNLDVELARIQPAISEARITRAESDFDAVFFTNLNRDSTDTPRPGTGAGLSVFGSQQSERSTAATGIRKNLSSGGQLTVQAVFARINEDPSFFSAIPNSRFHYHDTDIEIQLTQPLLRNFGSDVNRAGIALEQNARRETLQDLRLTLINVVQATEQAYWQLVFSRNLLLIQQRLLERTQADRDQLQRRQNFDVSPVRLTEANSFVELRRADVIRARQQVRLASDQLKLLINAPDAPIAEEILIVPVDEPADLSVTYSLLDAVTTALRHRPELRRALLEIDDASIRQRVADNQRLPVLNLGATLRYNGVGEAPGAGLDSADFIDYLLTAQFEVPIGNRGPEAQYREQQLQRQAAVVNYRRTSMQVITDVKAALRDLHTTFELIGAARAARRAAADNLRALEEQEEAGVALTPEFLLDLKLSTQQRLANAEIQEAQALADYSTAISRYYQSTGTLLDLNGIRLEAE